ncbi:MAG: hypothetical protein K2P14_03725 [Anaeroplasmataceae bacterium]|nr:hypothetical protein [Anaeroplasmataceae bacterium]
MLQNLVQILLLLTLLVQFILAIYMLYNTHRQYKNDKKFYEKLCKDLEEQQAVFLEISKGVECEYSEENADEE